MSKFTPAQFMSREAAIDRIEFWEAKRQEHEARVAEEAARWTDAEAAQIGEWAIAGPERFSTEDNYLDNPPAPFRPQMLMTSIDYAIRQVRNHGEVRGTLNARTLAEIIVSQAEKNAALSGIPLDLEL